MLHLLPDLLRPYRLRMWIAGVALLVAAGTMLTVGQGLRLVIDQGFAGRDPAWLASDHSPGQAGLDAARRFGERLAVELGLSPDTLQPGYEDWLHYLWREAGLPVDPQSAVEEDLTRVLGQGLDQITGFALPLYWHWGLRGWRSGPWHFPEGVMTLMPGSSPMGLRLPVGQLDWVAEGEFEETEWVYPPQEDRPLILDAPTHYRPPEHRLPVAADARPDVIRFSDALPKTRSGKIMRRILRALAAGQEVSGDTSTLEDRGVLDALRV